MSTPEKEAVLDTVLESVAKENTSSPVTWSWPLLAFGATAMAVLIALPLGLGWFAGSPEEDGLTARGGGPGPFGVQVACPGTDSCRPGSKLVFRVQAPAGRPWFSALGQRPDGVVTWYFPATAAGRSVDTRAGNTQGVLQHGVLLADDHPPGEVRLMGQFCSQAVQRPQIRAVYERNTDPEHIGCTLVEQIYLVSP